MSDFVACKKGFQTATSVFATAVFTQSVIVTAMVLVGVALH